MGGSDRSGGRPASGGRAGEAEVAGAGGAAATAEAPGVCASCGALPGARAHAARQSHNEVLMPPLALLTMGLALGIAPLAPGNAGPAGTRLVPGHAHARCRPLQVCGPGMGSLRSEGPPCAIVESLCSPSCSCPPWPPPPHAAPRRTALPTRAVRAIRACCPTTRASRTPARSRTRPPTRPPRRRAIVAPRSAARPSMRAPRSSRPCTPRCPRWRTSVDRSSRRRRSSRSRSPPRPTPRRCKRSARRSPRRRGLRTSPTTTASTTAAPASRPVPRACRSTSPPPLRPATPTPSG